MSRRRHLGPGWCRHRHWADIALHLCTRRIASSPPTCWHTVSVINIFLHTNNIFIFLNCGYICRYRTGSITICITCRDLPDLTKSPRVAAYMYAWGMYRI
jgi:hypothetical protein